MMIFKKSLRWSKKVFRLHNRLYQKRWKELAPEKCGELERQLEALQEALKGKQRAEAADLAKELNATRYFKKRWYDYTKEFAWTVALALFVTIVIRQAWFEPMEIPTGSMRPTYRELDRLVVSKTAFGLNVPLTPKHFYFDSDAIERGDIFIFTVEGMNLPDPKQSFFGFPGYKRLIKRCMGRPGDTLYFYGGQIYGVDRDGHNISTALQEKIPEGIDHVPMISFEGKPTRERNQLTLHHFGQPVATLSSSGWGEVKGKHGYSDQFGLGNYAMARLLTADEVKRCSRGSTDVEAPLYLELRHTPSIDQAVRRIREDLSPITTAVSILPLTEAHLEQLHSLVYTSRLVVEGGYAHRYAKGEKVPRMGQPYLPGVPDGTYEFFNGVAYQIKMRGHPIRLADDHPLNQRTPERLQWLFNLGMELHTSVAPQAGGQLSYPARYAYFRNGDLRVMNGTLMHGDDSTLVAFVDQEKGKLPSEQFIDHGPPVNAVGEIDPLFLEAYGLKIPEGMYLGLGDNHAGSGDCRHFGLVPEDNIRGAPLLVIWPFGERWGIKTAPLAPYTVPRLVVWSGFGLYLAFSLIRRRRSPDAIFNKLSEIG